MVDRKDRIETSIPDIPRFAGLTPALVHDGLEGFPQLIITPRRVTPLLEQLQGTVRSHMTTRLMCPLEECPNTVARHDSPVLMPEVGPVRLPLLLVDQGGFQTLLQAFVDVPKLFQVLIGARQPQNKLMRLRTLKKKLFQVLHLLESI